MPTATDRASATPTSHRTYTVMTNASQEWCGQADVTSCSVFVLAHRSVAGARSRASGGTAGSRPGGVNRHALSIAGEYLFQAASRFLKTASFIGDVSCRGAVGQGQR